MKGRAVLLVLSILVAAVGTGLIYAYVHSANSRATTGQALVPVLMASKDIPAGTPVTDELPVATGKIPASLVTEDTLTERSGGTFLRQLITANSTTRISINKNLPLQRQYFTSNASSEVSAGAPENVTMQVAIEGAEAGAGLLQPNQPVMVFVTLKSDHPKTQVLLPKATVISIDGRDAVADAASDGGSSRSSRTTGTQGTVALSVPIQDAEKVMLASAYSDRFSLYFAKPGTKTRANGPFPVATVQSLTRAVAG